jgi:hypothetical protein
VIRHCLEKDRGMRFQSARDLLFALDLAASTAACVPPAPAREERSLAWFPAVVTAMFRLL